MTVHNAHTLSLAMTLTTQLQTALLNRPVIDEAIGLIRSRTGVSSARARERLQTMSQHEHVKMVEIAQHLVDEAIRRTRARHTGS